MNNFLVLPILFLLITALIAMALPRNNKAQFLLGLFGTGGALVNSIITIMQVQKSGIQVMQAGNWPAPFGISLVADKLSAVMLLISNLLGFFILFYSWYEIDEHRMRRGFYPLMLMLLTGVNGALLTGDIFNLYVWFEVVLISSFSLLTLGNSLAQLKGALPYVSINLISSSLFLIGIGALYGLSGTLNFAELSVRLNETTFKGPTLMVSMIFLIALGIKAAIFPLFFWLPASYHTLPISISTIFAGLITKVAVYSLVRVFTLIFLKDMELIHEILLWGSGLTMVTGVLGAACQSDVRKILSFHIISQIGYMILGLALFTPLAIGGMLFFVGHNMLVKSNLFLVSGVVKQITGSHELDLQGGIFRSHPLPSIIFLISAFSLAGFPPSSGFWSKLLLIMAGLEQKEFVLVGVALSVGVLTLYSMTKIWMRCYWKPLPEGLSITAMNSKAILIPITILTLVSLLPVIFPDQLIEYFRSSGEELMNPDEYIKAVLRSGSGP